MELKDGIKTFHAKTRKEWRRWLETNQTIEKSVWIIIFHKESKESSIYYDEAVEEALCFGWVDSKPNKRDDKSYFLFFARRKPKSNWSKANRQRAEKMIEQGLMTPAGQAVIDLAKKSGTWEALIDIQNSVVPKDCRNCLTKTKLRLKILMHFRLHRNE